jgi:hypothetical protein
MRSDCITSRMLKIVLSHYLQYEAKVIAHAFPAGTMQPICGKLARPFISRFLGSCEMSCYPRISRTKWRFSKAGIA